MRGGPAVGEPRYDAVLFDVGGTLIGFVDSQPFRQFLESNGLIAGEEAGRQLHCRFLEVIRAERDRAGGVGATEAGLEAFWRSVFSLVWPERRDLAAAMFREFRANRFDRLFDDVRPTLDSLSQAGLRLGVISNFTGGLAPLLSQLGVRSYFEFVITSSQVGLAKPDRRIFDLAAERLGLPRRRLLYVGDHFGDDISGAWSAGLEAVLVDHGFRANDRPCPRIPRLLDLVRYVRQPAGPAQAVLFDFDGVVVDSFSAHARAWRETLSPLGVHLPDLDLKLNEGIPTEPMAQFFAERALGRAVSSEEVAELAARKRALFRQYFRPQPIPGVLQLLHDLHGRGYRLGLVTGGARSIVLSALEELSVVELFDVVVTAEDAAEGKPNPQPYQVAAARLGLAGSACLAVENAPPGIESARAAALPCVAVETTLPSTMLTSAARTFRAVDELADWLLSF